jgi:SAM-dependent methyltransferase
MGCARSGPIWTFPLAVSALSWIDDRLSGRVSLFHADADRVPFVDHFDAVGAFDVIEHIEDDIGALRLLRRVVKPSGGIMDYRAAARSSLEPSGRRDRPPPAILRGRACQGNSSSGLLVVLDTCFMGTLFVPQYLCRRLWVSRGGGKDFEGEHMLSAPVNGLLEAMLSLELMLVRAGLRLPFGGMRLVVARKDPAAETA